MTAQDRFARLFAAASADTARTTGLAFWQHDGLAAWASVATDAALEEARRSGHALPHELAVVEREIEWRRIEDARDRFEAELAIARAPEAVQ